ncbi:hypothetical protein [Bradyrhizobium sp. WSM2793]|uniref:hypothetical protein n=1 Tax=Bradyrhizobium sp. WSM2793 TaxID=1038866 RepID=UPI0012F70F21|nr:hypothetical protein [Bradyrhizobium sp. WSM2793]
MHREFILDLRGGVLILGVDEQDIPIDFIEPYACEQPVKRPCADDERHAGLDCLVVDIGELHTSNMGPKHTGTSAHWSGLMRCSSTKTKGASYGSRAREGCR